MKQLLYLFVLILIKDALGSIKFLSQTPFCIKLGLVATELDLTTTSPDKALPEGLLNLDDLNCGFF